MRKMFGDDGGFKIKRKKKTLPIPIEETPVPISSLQNISSNPEIPVPPVLQTKDKKTKTRKKRRKNLRKRRAEVKLPAYEPDEIVNKILKESIQNLKFYEPIHLILTNAKKELVRFEKTEALKELLISKANLL